MAVNRIKFPEKERERAAITPAIHPPSPPPSSALSLLKLPPPNYYPLRSFPRREGEGRKKHLRAREIFRAICRTIRTSQVDRLGGGPRSPALYSHPMMANKEQFKERGGNREAAGGLGKDRLLGRGINPVICEPRSTYSFSLSFFPDVGRCYSYVPWLKSGEECGPH